MQAVEQKTCVKVFISYAHADQELHKKLGEHLSPLEHSGDITIWQDQEIPLGANWEEQINTHLNDADLILLLVSASFIASKYCWNKEVQTALERHKAGTARVIPIILKPVRWQHTPLGQLQALPKEAKPVTQWNDQEAALENVAQGIEGVVEQLLIILQREEALKRETAREVSASPSEAAASTAEVSDTLSVSLPPDRPVPDAPSLPQRDEQSLALMKPIPSCSIEMAVYLVTDHQFKEFVEAKPYWRPNGQCQADGLVDNRYLAHWSKIDALTDLPVVNVNAIAAQAYLDWLGDKIKLSLRFPRSQEWEIAARAGCAREKWWEEEVKAGHVNYNNKWGKTQIGNLRPNTYGIYDLLGNIYDLCEDNKTFSARGGAYYSSLDQLIIARELNAGDCRPDMGFRYVHDLSYI